MKRLAFIGIVLFFMIYPAFTAYCGPMEKLARGIKNSLTFPLEVPKGIIKECKELGLIEGIGLGAGKGAANAGVKLLWGLYETATFIIPVPENYEPMLGEDKQ